MLSNSDIDVILREIIWFEDMDPQCDLTIFRSLVSANQYRHLYRLITQHVPAGGQVLDWGCGRGHFSYALERLGFKAAGYAFEDFHLRRYLSSSYAFKLGTESDPHSIPFPDERFDAVSSVGVLEHVRETGGDELASLREIWRILKPGGHLVCYHLPNRLSLNEAFLSVVSNRYLHPYKYNAGSIRQMCRESGFEIHTMRRYGSLPRNSWNLFPERIRSSSVVVRIYNALDEALSMASPWFCENYCFVSRKLED